MKRMIGRWCRLRFKDRTNASHGIETANAVWVIAVDMPMIYVVAPYVEPEWVNVAVLAGIKPEPLAITPSGCEREIMDRYPAAPSHYETHQT